MKKKLLGLYVKVQSRLSGLKNSEQGSATLEWIGIAALIVIIVGGLSQVFSGNTEFGDAIKKKLIDLVKSVG